MRNDDACHVTMRSRRQPEMQSLALYDLLALYTVRSWCGNVMLECLSEI
jgi:hypothetical protein